MSSKMYREKTVYCSETSILLNDKIKSRAHRAKFLSIDFFALNKNTCVTPVFANEQTLANTYLHIYIFAGHVKHRLVTIESN